MILSKPFAGRRNGRDDDAGATVRVRTGIVVQFLRHQTMAMCGECRAPSDSLSHMRPARMWVRSLGSGQNNVRIRLRSGSRRGGRVVDGTGLENRHTLTGIGGSNPSLSAIASGRGAGSYANLQSRSFTLAARFTATATCDVPATSTRDCLRGERWTGCRSLEPSPSGRIQPCCP